MMSGKKGAAATMQRACCTGVSVCASPLPSVAYTLLYTMFR